MVPVPQRIPNRVCYDVPDTPPPPPPQTCATIFAHNDFGGASWTIPVNGSSNDVSGNYIERRHYGGWLHGWQGQDITWVNNANSAKVSARCTLSIFAGTNFNGPVDKVPAPADREAAFGSLPTNAMSSFKCTCDGLTVGNGTFVH